MVAAFAFGCPRADVKDVVGVAIGNFDRPVAIENIGSGEDHGLVAELQKGSAVDGVVVWRVGHHVIGGRKGLHMADLVDGSRGSELAGLFKSHRILAKLALPLKDDKRQAEDVVLHSDGIEPLLLGLRVAFADVHFLARFNNHFVSLILLG